MQSTFDYSWRTHYRLENYDISCSSANDCPHPLCEDTSCAIESIISFANSILNLFIGNACLYFCTNMDWIFYPTTQESCQSEQFCNWNSSLCEGLNSTSCHSLCNQPPEGKIG